MGGIFGSDQADPNAGATQRLKEQEAEAKKQKQEIARERADALKSRLGGGGFSSSPSGAKKSSTLGG